MVRNRKRENRSMARNRKREQMKHHIQDSPNNYIQETTTTAADFEPVEKWRVEMKGLKQRIISQIVTCNLFSLVRFVFIHLWEDASGLAARDGKLMIRTCNLIILFSFFPEFPSCNLPPAHPNQPHQSTNPHDQDIKMNCMNVQECGGGPSSLKSLDRDMHVIGSTIRFIIIIMVWANTMKIRFVMNHCECIMHFAFGIAMSMHWCIFGAGTSTTPMYNYMNKTWH